jgi:nucleoside-diphosphate-sugar epimerase
MIAVTGANGLLGSYIVRKLIAEKESFVALKRPGSDLSLLSDVASSIRWRDADVLDPVALEDALGDVDQVIHTAAAVSFNPRKATWIMDCNVQGTRNIVNQCILSGVKRLVHISSVAALGRQKNQKLIDESNQWTEGSLNSTYGHSKYLAELEVFRAHEEGLSAVVVSPSIILGAADWNKSSGRLFHYVWNEKPFYSDAFLNYVDVRDVADTTYRLLKNNITGQRFILNAGSISFFDFFQRVAKRFQKKAPHIKLSPSVLSLVARVESFRTYFTSSEPLITRETARMANTEFLYSNDKIKKALSVDFQPIDETLDWCCQYYMTKYMHKN